MIGGRVARQLSLANRAHATNRHHTSAEDSRPTSGRFPTKLGRNGVDIPAHAIILHCFTTTIPPNMRSKHLFYTLIQLLHPRLPERSATTAENHRK